MCQEPLRKILCALEAKDPVARMPAAKLVGQLRGLVHAYEQQAGSTVASRKLQLLLLTLEEIRMMMIGSFLSFFWPQEVTVDLCAFDICAFRLEGAPTCSVHAEVF
jgi:hypothetical protein